MLDKNIIKLLCEYENSQVYLRGCPGLNQTYTDFDDITFNDLIRKGYEKGLLLNDLEAWKAYRKHRGITSHTYDENKAEDIYQNIPEFLTEVKYLFKQLGQRGLNAE